MIKKIQRIIKVRGILWLMSIIKARTNEDDLTHMPEITALPEAGDLEGFRARSLRNFENRCFHHHVFDTNLVASLVDRMGLPIYAIEAIQPMRILIIAKR